MTSLRFKTLLMLIVGLICSVPIHAYGYTMQDVQDYLEANPATNGCNNSTEEYVTNSQTGVKVWRKCPEFPDRVKYADSWYYGGNCRTYDTTEKVILCDGEGRQGMPVYGYSNNVCEARTSWARAVKCNGTVIESYQGPVSYPVVAESCYFSHSELSDCGKEINTLLADFYPITECTDADQDGFDAYNAQKCARGNDCNDSNADINPNSMWYKDIDGDSYTDGITTGPQCQRPSGYKLASELISLGNDCDDTKAQYNPAHTCCDLKVDSFTGTNTLLDPSSGGTVALNGSISDSSGKPITWTVAIAGRSYEGTGTSVSVIWDGLDPYGKVVEPGEYTATLNAKTDDGSCTDTKTINFKVLPPPPNSCGRYVQFGSSADTASGNLSHTQELFTTKGAGLTANMTLYYNSLDSNNGPLGKSWSHNYDISVKENSNGDVVLKEGNWKRKLYESNNGSYMSQPGDYSSLTKNPDSTFTITHKDGTRYSFNQDGKIASIQDRNGNVLAFAYTNGNLTTITDSAARTTALTYETNDKIATINDSNGNTHTLTYGGNDLIGVSTQPGGSQSAPTSWSYTYFANSFMQSKTDPNGYTTTYTYDSNHRVATSTDPEGKVRSITYPTPDDTSQTKTTTFTEKDGWVWTYIFDTQTGTLTSKTDPQNGTTSYTYDANRNMASKTEPDGSVTSYTYDINGNMTSQTDAIGQTTTYTYNGFGQVTSISAPDNTTTSYEYDAKGNLTKTTDSTGASTGYQYDAKGNVTQITNPAGQTTSFTYDQSGNLASVTDSSGNASTMTYDTVGNLTSKTDPNSGTTAYEYDSLNRVVKITDPAGNATTFGYDKNGNKTSVTDANGNTTFYEYNFKGKLVKVTDALGNSTTYSYTAGSGCSSCGSGGGDLLASVTDPNGSTTRFEYDNLGRRIKEVDPSGKATAYTYDAKGNILTRTDANGYVTAFSYDPLSRLQKLTDPMQGVVQFEYNTAGKAAKVTDALGNATAYEYDSAGHVTKTVSQDAGTTTYSYNTDGSLKTKTDGNGVTVTYNYDSTGRLTKIEYPNATENVNYTYDNCTNGKGRICTMADPSGTTAYEYDKLGRVSRETKTALSVTYTTGYEYDKVGNIKAMTYPSGRRVTYSYDALNHPVSVSQELNKGNNVVVSGIVYDGTGEIKSMTLGNGIVQTWSYDNNGWIGRIYAPTVIDRNYGYDPVGNILSITDGIDSSNNRTYSYDQTSRLTAAKGPWGTLTWSYDANGNRQDQGGSRPYTYSYNANRLETVTNGVTQAYQYDNTGSTTFDGTRTYLYNQNNRLIKAMDYRGLLAEYIYNGNGQRVIKTTGPAYTGSSSPQTTVYHYDLNGRLIGETAGNGSYIGEYLYLNGQPLALIRKQDNLDRTYYYHNDHIGTPTRMTDKLNSIVWKVDFDPFGNEVMENGREGTYIRNVTNNLRFPGQYYDAETGLHYNYYRDYDPRTGRYIEADPVGLKGGPNPFSYTNNNPILYTDIKGLMWGIGDYFRWYDNGGGNTVTLQQMGLLNEFVNSSSIQNAMTTVFDSYKNKLKTRLFEKCSQCDSTYETDSFTAEDFAQNYDVTYASIALLPIGDGRLFNSGYCSGCVNCQTRSWRGTCSLKFSIKDRFQDPWDYFDTFSGEYETGSPYTIYGEWSRSISWSE